MIFAIALVSLPLQACLCPRDVMSNDEAGEYMRGELACFHGENISRCCSNLIDTCLEKGSRDNMSALVVSMSGCAIGTQEAPPPVAPQQKE